MLTKRKSKSLRHLFSGSSSRDREEIKSRRNGYGGGYGMNGGMNGQYFGGYNIDI